MVTAHEIRSKYLKFFEELGHKVIPSAPLVPENDPTTLFTSSGMQPLVPYLLGQPHPLGKRLVDSQKSFRAQDIEEVGDNRHTTFFEMLGNWSLGDYFKEDQLSWFYAFLTKELQLSQDRLFVSVFEGNASVPKDTESIRIWKKLGIPEKRIYQYGAKKNWWSRAGEPENMPGGEPGGPDSEVFFDFGAHLKFHENSIWKNERCHPNCDCGRFLEIGNSVFMQYQKQPDGSLLELPQKNVDFGGGLERITAALNNDPDIFKTDLFLTIIEYINSNYSKGENLSESRIVADHIKAATFLIQDGVEPSNKGQGYMLRRLIRRAMVKWETLRKRTDSKMGMNINLVAQEVFNIYRRHYEFDESKVTHTISEEVQRFKESIRQGLNKIQKVESDQISGSFAFDLFQTYGFPPEVTEEILKQRGIELNWQEFNQEKEKHQELSRTSSKGMFKGGLEDKSETVVKYHTATHLLHQALRDVLGKHVSQKGSNITFQRLRFDFSHPAKLTSDEIAQVQQIVNLKISADLPVTRSEMPKTQALAEGALAFFPEKYPDTTSVYSIGTYSKELCGGPHVNHTGEIGKITITREESAGAGVRRIYAQLG